MTGVHISKFALFLVKLAVEKCRIAARSCGAIQKPVHRGGEVGSVPKRLVREWLASRDEETLFSSSAGQNPSLADVVKMVHPKPAGPMRQAF